MSALTVVCLQSTRHALAALTRAAPPGPGEPVKALVGTGLPVRAVGLVSTHFAIAASELAAFTVSETVPDVVLRGPQAFQVVDDPQDKNVHEVTQIPTPTSSSPQVSLALDLTHGAVVTLANVTSTFSLQAGVVLQKVTTPPQAATTLVPKTIGPGNSNTTIAPATTFAATETWDFAVFIQAMPPQALSQTL